MSDREWCAACARPVAVSYGPDLPTCSQCGCDELQPTWPCDECGGDISAKYGSDYWAVTEAGKIVCWDCDVMLAHSRARAEAREQREYADSEAASRWKERKLV